MSSLPSEVPDSGWVWVTLILLFNWDGKSSNKGKRSKKVTVSLMKLNEARLKSSTYRRERLNFGPMFKRQAPGTYIWLSHDKAGTFSDTTIVLPKVKERKKKAHRRVVMIVILYNQSSLDFGTPSYIYTTSKYVRKRILSGGRER